LSHGAEIVPHDPLLRGCRGDRRRVRLLRHGHGGLGRRKLRCYGSSSALERTLSTFPELLEGRKNTLITRLRTMNAAASTCVPRMRKSAVLRTPKTIPTFPRTDVPASPSFAGLHQYDDDQKRQMMISSDINNVNMDALAVEDTQ